MLDLLGSGALTIVSFALVISFVVIIHELGHYWMGRLFGVHAEAFSVGFGPTLFQWRDKKDTIWRVAALPLGGYVKFRGDANAASAPSRAALERLRAQTDQAETVLHFKPVWQRALIVAAGPLANFVLAIVIFAVLGASVGETRIEPRIGAVQDGAPAASAGFQPDDVIIAINGRAIEDFRDVQRAVVLRQGEAIDFTVRRDGRALVLTAAPEQRVLDDGFGGQRARGVLGVSLSPEAEIVRERTPVLAAPAHGVERTGELIGLTFDYLGRLVTGRASVDQLSGPLGIATTTGQVANAAAGAGGGSGNGASVSDLAARAANVALTLFSFAAIISVGLGIVNLLPVPILDGGHLVFYAYEAVAGHPPSAGVQGAAARIGLALIFVMFLVVTWNDVSYLRTLFS